MAELKINNNISQKTFRREIESKFKTKFAIDATLMSERSIGDLRKQETVCSENRVLEHEVEEITLKVREISKKNFYSYLKEKTNF